jgi:hypothetical protein
MPSRARVRRLHSPSAGICCGDLPQNDIEKSNTTRPCCRSKIHTDSESKSEVPSRRMGTVSELWDLGSTMIGGHVGTNHSYSQTGLVAGPQPQGLLAP